MTKCLWLNLITKWLWLNLMKNTKEGSNTLFINLTEMCWIIQEPDRSIGCHGYHHCHRRGFTSSTVIDYGLLVNFIVMDKVPARCSDVNSFTAGPKSHTITPLIEKFLPADGNFWGQIIKRICTTSRPGGGSASPGSCVIYIFFYCLNWECNLFWPVVGISIL